MSPRYNQSSMMFTSNKNLASPKHV